MYTNNKNLLIWNCRKIIKDSRLTLSLLAAVFFILFSNLTSFASEEAKRIVSLADYIGGDYKNAVQEKEKEKEEGRAEISC